MPDERYPQFPGSISVTEVIKAAGLMPESDFIDPWYLSRGSAAHLATAYYDRGTLDESTVAPEICGLLESWKLFRKDYTPTHIELPINDSLYGLCGTIDRLPLVDQKGPSRAAWHVLQLAGYAHLCRVNKIDYGTEAKIVHLDPEGGPPTIEIITTSRLRNEIQILLSALAVVRWKQKNMKGEKR